MLDRVLQQVDSDRATTLEKLKAFLRFPSVSTKPEHAKDLAACADWLRGEMIEAGLDAQIFPTPGHPIVLAKNEHRPGRPTVLVYGHYDVQPPEPLELWTTPPFEPVVRDGAIYARGAADDKGQVHCHVTAAAAWNKVGKPRGDKAGEGSGAEVKSSGAPVNLTFLIEGEEEIGSDHLETFVNSHRAELAADVAVISDTNQFARGVPALTYGLRGLCYMEVFLTGPDHDLHSGLYGGAVPNPANVLCQLLATLHDEQGRVNLPGFYDDVIPLTDAERSAWRRLPFDEKEFAASVGVPQGSGEAGYSSLERKWARPTLDINGLTSGYQGHGAKTVIASVASAKVSMRLVPDMDPAKIQAIFEKTLRQRCPQNVMIEFKQHGLAGPVLVPVDGAATRLAAEAMKVGFGTEPAFMREGGSIPVVALIKRSLGIDTLLLGFGLPDDRVHSPNEKFDLDALHAGTRTAAALYEKLSHL